MTRDADAATTDRVGSGVGTACAVWPGWRLGCTHGSAAPRCRLCPHGRPGDRNGSGPTTAPPEGAGKFRTRSGARGSVHLLVGGVRPSLLAGVRCPPGHRTPLLRAVSGGTSPPPCSREGRGLFDFLRGPLVVGVVGVGEPVAQGGVGDRALAHPADLRQRVSAAEDLVRGSGGLAGAARRGRCPAGRRRARRSVLPGRGRLRILPQAAQGAVDLLRYDRDRPDLQDRETRTVLARLLSLYAVALRRGDDPVIGLGANLRR